MIEIDYKGLRCPLPVIRAYKLLKNELSGKKYLFLSDDPSSPKDFKDFCDNAGYTFLKSNKSKDNVYKILIKT